MFFDIPRDRKCRYISLCCIIETNYLPGLSSWLSKYRMEYLDGDVTFKWVNGVPGVGMEFKGLMVEVSFAGVCGTHWSLGYWWSMKEKIQCMISLIMT